METKHDTCTIAFSHYFPDPKAPAVSIPREGLLRYLGSREMTAYSSGGTWAGYKRTWDMSISYKKRRMTANGKDMVFNGNKYDAEGHKVLLTWHSHPDADFQFPPSGIDPLYVKGGVALPSPIGDTNDTGSKQYAVIARGEANVFYNHRDRNVRMKWYYALWDHDKNHKWQAVFE